jgi:hypothetical protein
VQVPAQSGKRDVQSHVADDEQENGQAQNREYQPAPFVGGLDCGSRHDPIVRTRWVAV